MVVGEPSPSARPIPRPTRTRLHIPGLGSSSVLSPNLFSAHASSPGVRPTRGPKKKALLIGINYDTSDVAPEVSDNFEKLKNPRSDVQLMKDLLIKSYGYKDQDITVMIDSEGLEDKRLLPTKANIEREAARLIYGARPGDRFVFLFSGHSDQIENKTGSEDDGQDEQMVTLDAKIIDNKLNRLLVQPLPVGAHLTAILDSCHSGTMLDLVHDKCNRIYVPWISKGQRLTAKTRWMTICRRNATLAREPMLTRLLSAKRRQGQEYAMDVSLGVMAKELNMPPATPFTLPSSVIDSLSNSENTPASDEAETRRRRRVTLGANFKPLVKAVSKSQPQSKSKQRGRAATVSQSQARELPIAEVRSRPEPTEMEKYVADGGLWCQSPVSLIKCDGFCHPADSLPMPHVVSLAACNDPQEAWEGPKGQSMTQTLVNYLGKYPHPTYRQLHEAMSYGIYNNVSRKLHGWSKKKHEYFKRKAAAGKPVDHAQLEQVNFQDFQMTSQKKMDLNDIFDM